MKQGGGFQLFLIAVILAGVGVFAFSVFDSTSDAPPARHIAEPTPSTERARPAPQQAGPSEKPAVAENGSRDASATAAPDTTSSAAVSTAPTPSRSGPPVAERTVDPLPLQTPRPTSVPKATVTKPATADRSSAHDRGAVAAGSDPSVPSSRVPSRPAPRDGGAVAASPSTVGSVAAFSGRPESPTASDSTQPSPTVGADGGNGGEADAGAPLPGQQAGGGPAAPSSLPSDPNDNPSDEPPPPPPVVQLVPRASELGVGEHVTVDVVISSATDVGHVPFHLTYDPAVLRFEFGEEGPFLGSDGVQTAFFAAAMSTPGTVLVGLSRLGRVPGVSGAGGLCTLHFEALGPGTTALTFDRQNVRAPDLSIINALFQPATIVVR